MVRELNNIKSVFLMFPSPDYWKSISIKRMMGADDPDFSGTGVTMRSVISSRSHRWRMTPKIVRTQMNTDKFSSLDHNRPGRCIAYRKDFRLRSIPAVWMYSLRRSDIFCGMKATSVSLPPLVSDRIVCSPWQSIGEDSVLLQFSFPLAPSTLTLIGFWDFLCER